MKKNESNLDRIIRVILGVVLLVLSLIGAVSGVWVWIFTIIGAILLVTGIVGFCPLYTLLKIKTN